VKRRGRPPKGAGPPESVEGRILDSACRLFYTEGVRATGIDRILSRAGAAKASLYAHYGSKDDLVRAYLERQAQAWMARVQERIAPADGRAGVLRLFEMLGEFASGEDFRGCPFLNATSELADPSHPARAVLRRQREWLHSLIRSSVPCLGSAMRAPSSGASPRAAYQHERGVAGSTVTHRPSTGSVSAAGSLTTHRAGWCNLHRRRDRTYGDVIHLRR